MNDRILPGPSTETLRARYAWSVPNFAIERPSGDPAQPELWCYADRFSYDPGDVVNVHVHTTAVQYDVRVLRDGANPTAVWEAKGLPGQTQETPDNAYEAGCGWRVSFSIPIDDNWRSGFYLVILSMEFEGRIYEREGFFVLRRAASSHPKPYVLVLTTSTMIAYNDWGGANHYRGLGDDPYTDIAAPRLSTQRPVARGMLRQPPGTPRASNPTTPGPGYVPRHPAYEWAHVHGYSRHASDAFWSSYERPFVVWAEEQGYDLDFLTQQDLHESPDCLSGYSCAIFVGHDEYWTSEMRDRVDSFVDHGGHVARFAGNFLWQVRLEDNGTRQICYKDPTLDPIFAAEPTRTTTAWDAPFLERPGAATMGLTGLAGCYNRYGATTPRSSGGFTVFRPSHWAFEDTDLYYGDVFGNAPICVAAFELDGVDYTFRKGLPYATGSDGAPANLEIIAMAPAVIGEIDKWNGAVPIGAPADEVKGIIEMLFGDQIPDRFTGEFYGSGMIATFERGAGSVFNAGTTDWVNGLIHADPFTEKITHNVLNRFGSRK
ncbi:hypothetical protein SAMN05892877_12334 [Rhizobium subbaraonis]|uniref:N,N-dimethylformamidase beta subunit-like C-terminal domain-containing protein n=1 Tax=Rhizobium subbaraonis TaxID=908946 RepID=A0A285UXM5_9HYPH|nr:N,N-dimethylformamidase beta subunit family domain-containing protein [Rhizobium subbaraonis]SOC46570.1 hypothetical protein SAMN05892877_12334 [Rhizobium subbaraonis]